MNSLKNRVTLIGNLGKDIEIKTTKNGRKYAKFSVATNENYKSSNGDKVTDTQWHNIVAWGKIAEIMSDILSKGNELAVEGRLSYSKYEDKEGITRYSTDIILNDFYKLTKSDVPI